MRTKRLLTYVIVLQTAFCFGQDDVDAIVAYSEAEYGFNMAHDVLAGDLYLLESDYRLDSFSLGLLDKSKLRIIRNTFFARHGYEFRSKDLNTHFQTMPWYKPSSSYSDTMLTKIDKFNIEIVQSFESIDIAQAPELEADDIVGLWHVSLVMPSGWASVFQFYDDGSFTYRYSQMRQLPTILSFSGSYLIEGNSIVLQAKTKTYFDHTSEYDFSGAFGYQWRSVEAKDQEISLRFTLPIGPIQRLGDVYEDLEGFEDRLFIRIGGRQF